MDMLTIIIMTRNTVGIDQRTLWVGLQCTLTCGIGSQVQTVAFSASFGEDIMGQSQTVITKVPAQGEGIAQQTCYQEMRPTRGKELLSHQKGPEYDREW